MIRIGLVRFLIKVDRRSENGGMVGMSISLIPQAEKYRVSKAVWSGAHRSIENVEVPASIVSAKRSELEYDLKAKVEAETWGQMADSLATDAVNQCMNSGLVDYAEFEKQLAAYAVKVAIMKAAEKGESDAIERVPLIDLVADMEALRVERERMAAEAQRLADEAMGAHLAEMGLRNKANREFMAKSMDLLYEYLTKDEAEEAKSKGYVTVRNFIGEFRVTVKTHGMIKKFVNDKCTDLYCVVFNDWSIPIGDECLMKIIMLKADPKRLLKIANRFPPNRYAALQ